MNQQLTTTEQKRTPMTIAAGLKPQLSESLPKHIDPDAFARTIQTALQVQPDLMQATPRSLMTACMKAATDGLILDGREAALVMRNVNTGNRDNPKWEKQATYQPMVQGLMKLARNSGQIASIVAHVVYENDKFDYVLGDNERIEHAPAPLTQDRGKAIAAYAIVKLTDETTIREVMRASEILNIGSQGSNSYQYDPAKGKNYAEWWRKTVIRRITKYIPRSSDAVGRFEQAAKRIDEDFDFEAEQPEPAAPVKKRGAAAAALAGVGNDQAMKDITPQPNQNQPDLPPHDAETGEILDADEGPQQGDDI
jgi:recombination protein RecT